MSLFQLHPDRVVSFYVAYGPTGPIYSLLPSSYKLSVRNVGAFVVTRRNGDDAEFARYQYAYPNHAGTDPCDDMRSLLDKHTGCLVLLPLPRLRYIAAFGPPDMSKLEHHVLPIHDAGPQRSAHFLRTDDKTIRAIAGENNISLGSRDRFTTLSANHSGERAQAIWVSWATLALRNDPDQLALLAAHQAWHSIECSRGTITF